MSQIKQKILVTNNFIEAEYLKSLAKQGNNTIGFRVMNTIDLCDFYLMKLGKNVNKRLINSSEQIKIVSDLVKNIANPFFENSKLDDINYIVNTLNDLRMALDSAMYASNDDLYNIIDSKLSDDKKDAINELIQNYDDNLIANNLIDNAGYIKETIMLINAIDDIELIRFGRFSVLEEELLTKIGCINNLSVDKDLKVNNFTKAYGITNEIDACISKIYNTESLDSCLIVAPNSYNDYIVERMRYFNIPFTDGMGMPIRLSNPGKLLLELINMEKNYYGVDAYKELFKSYFFDYNKLFDKFAKGIDKDDKKQIIKSLGWLKINIGRKQTSNLEKINEFKKVTHWSDEELKVKDIVADIANELNKDIEYLFKEYCTLRGKEGKSFDKQALDKIIDEIKVFKYPNDFDYIELFEHLSTTSIGNQISKPGNVHITSIDNAFGVIRDNVYILGMGANDYPGKQVENYLVTDLEYKSIIDSKLTQTKDNILEYKKQILLDLVSYYNKYNSNVNVSYSFYNVTELAECNPSIVFYELLSENGKELKYVDETKGYFDNGVEPFENICKKNINNDYNVNITSLPSNSNTINHLDLDISSTGFETFIQCPLKFYTEKILFISDNTDKVTEVMPATDEGDIVHDLIERLIKEKWTETEFINEIESTVMDYFRKRPNISNSSEEKERCVNRIKDNLKNVYSYFCSLDLYCSEKKYKANISLDSAGTKVLKFNGKPDIVVKDGDDLVIIDIKNKDKVEHSPEFEKCCQTMLYAKLIEQKDSPMKVSKAIYYYTKNNPVEIPYNDDEKEKMEEYMEKLYEALTNVKFESAISIELEKLRGTGDDISKDKFKNGVCKYCKFNKYCADYIKNIGGK